MCPDRYSGTLHHVEAQHKKQISASEPRGRRCSRSSAQQVFATHLFDCRWPFPHSGCSSNAMPRVLCIIYNVLSCNRGNPMAFFLQLYQFGSTFFSPRAKNSSPAPTDDMALSFLLSFQKICGSHISIMQFLASHF